MGVFQAVAGTLENGVTAYVNTTASVLAAALVPVASAGLSIWAVLYGVAVVRGEVHEPLWGFTWKLFKTAFILSIALGQGVYQTHIVTMIYSVADGLVTTMAGGAAAACMVGGKGQQVYATLDCTWTQFMEVGMAYYRDGQRVGFFSAPDVVIARFISALLVWISGTLFTVVMAAEIVVARFMLGLALVFGPICIASLAFEPSKKYFDGWASFIWFCVVMQAVCVAFLGLGMLSIGAVMEPFSIPSAAANIADGATAWSDFEKAIRESGNAWSAILAIVTLFLLLTYIGAFRLSGLASAITGGGSHSSLTGAAAAFVAGQVLRGVGGGSDSGQQGGQIANAGPPSQPSGNTMQTGGSIGPTASQQAAKEGRSSFNASYSGYSSSDTASASSQGTNYNTSTTCESYRSDLHRASHKTGENVGRSVGRAAEMMRKRMKP